MKKIISQLGLEESESKVYLALLELGPSSVSEVTKKAQITRTLGYHVLEKLGWYGLVSRSSGKGKKLLYVAEHPRSLVQYVKNKNKSWEERAKKAEQLLPSLLSIYRKGDKPVLRFQDGIRGVINLFEESLETKGEILSIFDVESWHVQDFIAWAEQYHKERIRRQITERILLLDTPESRAWMKEHKNTKYTIYRWVQKEDVRDLFEFGGELNIYDKKLMIAMLQKPHRMGVIIESAPLANLIRALFEIVWKHAEPVFPKKKS